MRVELLIDVTDSGSTLYLLVRLEAQAPASAERPPVNLALVIDRSSSMRGPRITHAIEASLQLVEQLDARDRLAIIAFDATARTIFGPEQLGDDARKRVADALGGLRTGVGTNLAAGIKKGAAAVRSGFVRGALSRLVMLTDGQPSIGITDANRLCRIAETESSRGVTLTAMGLGEGFDDELLADLAKSGRGGFHYLASAADIPGAFGRELAGVFSIAATRTELKLKPSDDITSVEVIHRLPSRPLDDGLVVEMGDLAAAAPRQVLFRLGRRPDSGGNRCGTLAVTYQQAGGTSAEAHLLGIEVPSEIDPDERRTITLERIRIEAATAIDVAWARRASGDSMRALAALGEIKSEIEDMYQKDLADRHALSALLEDIAQAEKAVARSSAEREHARRSMRERSHITLLGQSTVRKSPPGNEDE